MNQNYQRMREIYAQMHIKIEHDSKSVTLRGGRIAELFSNTGTAIPESNGKFAHPITITDINYLASLIDKEKLPDDSVILLWLPDTVYLEGHPGAFGLNLNNKLYKNRRNICVMFLSKLARDSVFAERLSANAAHELGHALAYVNGHKQIDANGSQTNTQPCPSYHVMCVGGGALIYHDRFFDPDKQGKHWFLSDLQWLKKSKYSKLIIQ